ncbi:hypothetical protein D3C76_1278090 [compost metagenome]
MFSRTINGSMAKDRPSRHLPMKAGSSSSSTRWRSNSPRNCQSLLLNGTVSTLLLRSSWVNVPGLTNGSASSRLMI